MKKQKERREELEEQIKYRIYDMTGIYCKGDLSKFCKWVLRREREAVKKSKQEY